jgi:hypothetical protein
MDPHTRADIGTVPGDDAAADGARSSSADPSVVLFVGAGRSGSTVVEMLLAADTDSVGVGELRWLWQRGYLENNVCSCGQHTRDCPFWSQVFERVRSHFAGDDDLEQSIRAYNAVLSKRIAPLFPVRRRALADQMVRARRLLRLAYEAISEVAGGVPIVDPSKVPTFAHLVSTTDGLNVAYLSIVRDSRAVAYSWRRRKVRPEVQGPPTEMARPAVAKVALEWCYRYLALAYLWPRIGRRTEVIRYEAFAEAPEATLARVRRRLEMLHLPVADRPEGPPNYHSVSGNPIRFERQPLVVKPDLEWRTELRWPDRLLTTALTAPLLAHHHLAVRRQRARRRRLGRQAGG